MVYQDSDFLVIDHTSALPKRCYKCNSRKIVAIKTQTVEYTSALEQVLDFAVGQIIPIPLSLSKSEKVIQLNLYFCSRHYSAHRVLFKIGIGILLLSAFCLIVAILANNYSDIFVVLAITSVVGFGIGSLTLYIEREREIVSRHKYQAHYFWIKGFGREYLSSFPKWTNSSLR